MKKSVKSQISVFIIISIIILVLVVGYFILKSNIKQVNLNPEISPIYSYTLNCIEETAEDALIHIGKTGGYVIVEGGLENYVVLSNYSNNEIAYYVNKKNLMPSKERIQLEIEDYMDSFLGFCLNTYSKFPDYNISYENSESNVKINENNVVFDVKFPIKIEKEEKTYELEDFNKIKLNVRLGTIYNAAKEITENQINHQQDICISCLNEISEKYNLKIGMSEYDSRTVIFKIVDGNSEIYNKENYEFNFANKYIKNEY